MIGVILAFFAIIYLIGIVISVIVAVSIILFPLIVSLLPLIFRAAIFIVLFFVAALVLWLITKNLLISFCIFAAFFALVWFVGDDSATIKARLEKERLSKQNPTAQ